MARFGLGSYVGFGEIAGSYATNGGAGDITHWFKIPADANDVHLVTDLVRADFLTDYEDDIARVFNGTKRVEGTITFPITYDQTQNLFRMISGENEPPALDPTYGTFYHYDYFTPPAIHDPSNYVFGSSPHNYCIELHLGDTSGDSVYYQGCVPTETKFTFEPGSIVMVTLSFVGRGVTTGAKSTPTFASNYMVLPTGQRSRSSPPPAPFFSMNGIGYQCYSGTFTISQPVTLAHEITEQECQVQPTGESARRCMIDAEIRAPDDDAIWMTLMGANQVKSAIVKNAGFFTSIALEHDAIWGGVEMAVKPGIEPRPDGPGEVRARLSMESYVDAPYVASFLMGVRNQQSNYMS